MSEPTVDQDRIDDMNEVIAIFDGYQFRKGDPNHKCNFCFAGDEPCAPAVDRFIKDCRVYYHFELKYHSSWDALMPVGKKIYDLLAEMAKKRPPHTACHGDLLEVDIHCHIREYDRPKAHKAIYEFIQWYNKQKQ
jgi:hypothetical protein